MTTYIRSHQLVEHLSGELLTATYAEMKSSFYEMSTPVADSVYIKNIFIKNPFTYTEKYDSSGVRYPTGVKSAGFRCQFEASVNNCNTTKQSVCGGQYIYIYIYIYIYKERERE